MECHESPEMATSARERTTVEVKRPTHQRLEELKPYDSMSFDEFISETLDVWENQQEN